MTVDADLHRRSAPARAALYRLLADLLSYPTPGVVQELGSGELAARVGELVTALPYPIETDVSGLRSEVEPVEVESEFIRLFDAPIKGDPVPLYGGVYHSDRKAVMEELLRFYRHFGLTTVNASANDLPDAVPTVLEFLSHLVLLEAAEPEPEGATPVRRAQRDLLGRHIATWMPAIDARLVLKEPLGCYRTAVKLTKELVAAELAALT